jgi:tetratricopeptide (TPR) repeat protein
MNLITMKRILIFFLFISANGFAQNAAELLILQHDGKLNLAARYGNGLIEKTDEDKAIDAKFINDEIKQFGSKDSASIVLSKLGYYYFCKGDISTAMKRFNQAWLMDTTNALEYFGFSSVLKVIKCNPSNYFETWLTKIETIEEPQKYYDIGLRKDISHKYEKIALFSTAAGFETYGKLNYAIESCNKLLELNTIDTLVFHQRGHLYTVSREWNKAIDDLLKAFPHGNNNCNALNDLGFAYDQIDDYKNASFCYDKASLINPNFLNPIYNNSILKLKIGEYQSALEYIEKCIKIRDDVGDFYRTKGLILIKLNLKDEGIKNLKKAKKLGDKEAEKIIEENK